MDNCKQKCFSNKIIFSHDVNSVSFSPTITYSGIYDSYVFGYVDCLLATNIDIQINKRRQILCNKCNDVIKSEKQFKVCLEFGYRDNEKCIKKGHVFISFLNLDTYIRITALIPPFSNYMDAKLNNFNIASPECDCFCINANISIANYPQDNTLQYMFISSLQQHM
ncbi:SWPV1-261 [Shearwaterpox virus]|uniref:SWPV1-261 n=1 Tax=Shearwaterpox virus TaxID=1974596 RepID=A0A1V0S867_CNPV|nr:SWPV1-261 [Shearwaterpox virus]